MIVRWDTTADSALPVTFQGLTEEDRPAYGAPARIHLAPPPSEDPRAAKKRADWIAWRAAPYPARRHSEYLHRPDVDGAGGPRILLSAVLRLPERVDDYLARFNSKRRLQIRGGPARRRGYAARAIDPAEESAGIWEVVHSTDERQGRGIAALVGDRPRDFDFSDYRPYADPNYRDVTCGVFSPDGALAAYLLGRRVGDHVQYDEVMGHADHLKNEVMYLLHFEFLRLCLESEVPPWCLNYGPWYSGANPFSPEGGLNRWKRKVRFEPAYLILASS